MTNFHMKAEMGLKRLTDAHRFFFETYIVKLYGEM